MRYFCKVVVRLSCSTYYVVKLQYIYNNVVMVPHICNKALMLLYIFKNMAKFQRLVLVVFECLFYEMQVMLRVV